MSFIELSAGVLLLSISFFIISYSLIWLINAIKINSKSVENNYQETKEDKEEKDEYEDYFNTPSIKRFDERMERMKIEMAEANIPERGKTVRSGEQAPVKPGILYEIDDEIVDKYISEKDMERDEVSI